MNEKFEKAGKCLGLLFWAHILGLIATVVAFVPLLGKIAYIVLLLIACVFQFYGLYVARDSHPNFKNAFYASLVSLIVAFFSSFFQEGFMAGLMQVVTALVSFCITYFICTAAGELLAEKGDTEQAVRAGLIWKLYAGCMAVTILVTILGHIPVLDVIAAVAVVITAVVELVAHILLIMFYYKASNSLKAA